MSTNTKYCNIACTLTGSTIWLFHFTRARYIRYFGIFVNYFYVRFSETCALCAFRRVPRWKTQTKQHFLYNARVALCVCVWANASIRRRTYTLLHIIILIIYTYRSIAAVLHAYMPTYTYICISKNLFIACAYYCAHNNYVLCKNISGRTSNLFLHLTRSVSRSQFAFTSCELFTRDIPQIARDQFPIGDASVREWIAAWSETMHTHPSITHVE